MKTDAASYVLRIDKATGKTVWRVERPTRARVESPDAYTTPTVLRHNGSSELVVSGADVVTGHDLATGKEVWRADGLNPHNDSSQRIVASPIVFGEMLFVPSRERPLLAFKAGGRGDVTRSSLAWSFDNGPDVPTPVTDGSLPVRRPRQRHDVVPRRARPENRSTHASGSSRPPTAAPRCSPTAASTSPTKTA